MAIFSHTPTPEEKVKKLENDAQTAMQRIGMLRAEISKLANEEKQVQAEYDAVKLRTAFLQKRSEELSKMKQEEDSLTADIRMREEKQKDLQAHLTQLQDERKSYVAQIATLRSQVSNESKGAEQDKLEVARLEKILADNAARKEKIVADTEFCKTSQAELLQLEEQYKQIAENIPLMRKQYELTRRLVEEMRGNTDPVAKSILEIWQKLPDDVLDKRLIINQRPSARGK